MILRAAEIHRVAWVRIESMYAGARWFFIVSLFVMGCGSTQRSAPVAPPDPSPSSEAVEIAGIELPDLPMDVAPDDEVLSSGWDAARASLVMPALSPPLGERWQVEVWVEEAFPSWLRQRALTLAEAQRALEPARQGDVWHSVVASALLGIVHTRFALDLHGIDVPDAFRSDEERMEAFQLAMRNAARPLWRRAVDAFGSCASAANEAPIHALAAWRQFCDTQLEQAQVFARSAGSETTESPSDQDSSASTNRE